MDGIVRFGVSIPGSLLKNFDRLIAQKGYPNRSEAIRDLIRDNLVKEEWSAGNTETVGTITFVYDHKTRELSRLLTGFQHTHYKKILSSLHIHLDEHHCLEVLVVRGKGKDLKALSDRLIGTKGVKHGGLCLTSSGKGLK